MVIVITFIIHRLLLQKLKPWNFLVWKNKWLVHTVALELFIWITSSLSIFLKILVHALSRYPSFSECHTRKFLLEICSLVVLLVTTGSTMIETSESLLWTTNTRFYHLARAGIAWASFNSVSIDRLGIYISDPKSSKSFFWRYEEDNLRRNW